MTRIRTIETSKTHPRTRLYTRFRLAIEVERTIRTIPRPKLFACHCQGAILAISKEDAFAGGSDKYFGIGAVVDLDLVAVV